MDLTLEQIYDFNICPMMYKFKYIMKIHRERHRSVERKFHEAVRKTIMFFYYQMLNDKLPSEEQLRQKFGSIFYKDMTPTDILAHSTLDSNLNALSLQGVKTLSSFYDRETNKKFVPIMVDQDARIPVGKHHLVMTVDLVREMHYHDRKLIEVVKFTNTPKSIDAFNVNHNLSLTAHSYAFRKLFGTIENRLVIQHMKSGKELFAIRKEHELKRFEVIIDNIADSIAREQFYPVHNMQCGTCPYRDVCDKYRF